MGVVARHEANTRVPALKLICKELAGRPDWLYPGERLEWDISLSSDHDNYIVAAYLALFESETVLHAGPVARRVLHGKALRAASLNKTALVRLLDEACVAPVLESLRPPGRSGKTRADEARALIARELELLKLG